MEKKVPQVIVFDMMPALFTHLSVVHMVAMGEDTGPFQSYCSPTQFRLFLVS